MPVDLPDSEFCLPGSDVDIPLGTSTISGLTYFKNLESQHSREHRFPPVQSHDILDTAFNKLVEGTFISPVWIFGYNSTLLLD